MEIKSRIMITHEPVAPDTVVETRARISRRFKIYKRDYWEHGFTLGCPGCDAVKANRPSVNHNEECRARMEVALGSVGDPRVQKVLEDAAAQEVEEDMPDQDEDPTDLFCDMEDGAEDMSVAGSADEVFSLGVNRSLLSLTASVNS